MDPADILRRTWGLYRSHARRLVAIALAVYVPIGVAGAALGEVAWPGLVAANVLNLLGLFLVQGAVVTTVDDVRRGGGERGVGRCLAASGRRLGPVALAGALATLGIIGGLLLLIVPGLVLLTWWLVIPPVIMLESASVADAFGRSRDLVRGHEWPVFGVAVLTLLVLLAMNVAVGLALSPLDGPLYEFLVTVIGSAIAAPFAGVAWTLTYFRLRERDDARRAVGAPGYTASP
jgi:hypothetical protein